MGDSRIFPLILRSLLRYSFFLVKLKLMKVVVALAAILYEVDKGGAFG